MQPKILTASAVVCVLVTWMAGCTKTVPVPTATTTTTTTSSTTTTSVPVTFAVRGTVTAETNGEPVRFADIEIIQGANIGKRFQADGSGNYALTGLASGTFVARYWGAGYIAKDVSITISNGDVTQNVQLTPAEVTPTPSGGTYGPATFTLQNQTCSPAFFNSTFTATVLINGALTTLTLNDPGGARQSTGSVSGAIGTFTGSGLIGSAPGTWTETATWLSNSAISIVSRLHVNAQSCDGTFQSNSMPKQ